MSDPHFKDAMQMVHGAVSPLIAEMADTARENERMADELHYLRLVEKEARAVLVAFRGDYAEFFRPLSVALRDWDDRKKEYP